MRNQLIVSAAALQICALTSHAHALTKEQSMTKGNQVYASSWSSDGCSNTGLYIYAFEQNQRGSSNKTASNSVYVEYYSYDYCSGTDTWGSAVIDSAAFQQQRLDNATLSVTGTMSLESCTYSSSGGGGVDAGAGSGADGGLFGGYSCSQSSPTLTLNAVWTGTGDISRDRQSYTSSTPHARYTYRASAQTRDANVSGTVSFGSVSADLSGAFASISISSSGSFEIDH